MRLILLVTAGSLLLGAQIDPDYVVPKENPHAIPSDIKRGQQLFMGHCAACHGPKGEGARGPVLARAKLPRAPDDETLFKLVRDGIPGTEMPAAWVMISREIWQVVAYLRTLGKAGRENLPGDPARGETLYTKSHCAQCHTISGKGGSVGPELTEIGGRRSGAYLRAALVDPAAAVPEGFLQVEAVTGDGRRLTGIRLNEDTYTIQIRDTSERPHSFFKSELQDLRKLRGKSLMPGYRGAFSERELDDLVAYLASLRGGL